ncbi:MAG TPA: cysteine desulfurase [Clostridiaceae bacterium]|nr:cysteine desulfurase [Clostridiaceae bacterium]
MQPKDFVYLDHAATTPLRQAAIAAMRPYEDTIFGNPSALYRGGILSKRAVRLAREEFASALGCLPEEIYFTSGGTESDNWVIKGFARDSRLRQGGRHIITGVMEHHAILHSCKSVAEEGFNITYLPCDENGCYRVNDLAAALRPDTILVSLMLANNETGVIQPIREMAALCRTRNIPFHTDAVQCVGHIPIDVDNLGIDLLSLSGHKFGGPKGSGALYIRKGTELSPFMDGGEQERMRRAGTENVAGIVGMGAALAASLRDMEKENQLCRELKGQTIHWLRKLCPDMIINGRSEQTLSGHLNVTLPGHSAETLILQLDQQGIYVSAGSACASGSPEPSHVLTAMGRSFQEAQCTLRLTFGMQNQSSDINQIKYAFENILGA